MLDKDSQVSGNLGVRIQNICATLLYHAEWNKTYLGLATDHPGSSAGKESTCNAETKAQFLGQEDLLQKE